MLARINDSLGEEVMGEGRDAIIGDVLEISTLPLVRKMWQLLEKRRVVLLYSVQLENLMEVHRVTDDANCWRRNFNLCKSYMFDMVPYYVNLIPGQFLSRTVPILDNSHQVDSSHPGQFSSRTVPIPDNSHRTIPIPDSSHPGQFPPDNSHPGHFPSRTIPT